MKTLSAQDTREYYMGYAITDSQRVEVSGSNGALLNSSEARIRWLEVSIRTGSYNLDNSHKVGERQMQSGGSGTPPPLHQGGAGLRPPNRRGDAQTNPAAGAAPLKIKDGRTGKTENTGKSAPSF